MTLLLSSPLGSHSKRPTVIIGAFNAPTVGYERRRFRICRFMARTFLIHGFRRLNGLFVPQQVKFADCRAPSVLHYFRGASMGGPGFHFGSSLLPHYNKPRVTAFRPNTPKYTPLSASQISGRLLHNTREVKRISGHTTS